jgi:hypothetical protein
MRLFYYSMVRLLLVWCGATGPMYSIFFFSRLYPFFTSHRVSVWLVLVISLLLTNTLSLVESADLPIHIMERFRRSQKEDERGPLSTVYHTFMVLQLDSVVLMHGSLRFLLVLFSTSRYCCWFCLVLVGTVYCCLLCLVLAGTVNDFV